MKRISNNIILINSAAATDAIAVIDVLGEIGFDWWTGEGFTKDSVLAEFKGKKLEEVHFNISSLGGDYFEALAIKNMALQTGATIKVHYFGMVASAATEIGNSASRENTTMASDGYILIHNTSTWAGGKKEEILKTYETLAKFDEGISKNYAAKSGKKTAEEFAAQMTKDQWMNADEAEAWGLVGKTTPAQPLSANSKLKIFASAEKLKIAIPQNFQTQNTEDVMSTKKSAQTIINEFFAGIKAAGMKLVSDKTEEKPEDTNKKVKDLTDVFIKNVEEATTAAEETTVTNAADYSASVTVAVDSIELEDGTALDLPNAPYEVSADGATALATDLNAAITADSVTVTYDEARASLSISVTGTESVLATVNGSVSFTSTTSEEDPGEGTNNVVNNLKKEIANNKKLLEAEKKKGTQNKVSAEEKKLRDELNKVKNELTKVKKGKSAGNSAGVPIHENNGGESEEEEGLSFVRNTFKK